MPTTLTSTNITAVQFKESASPGTPSSGYGRVWVYTDGALHYINDAGTNFDISGIYTGAMAIASQAIGDLIIATSTTQLGRVADVAVGQVLVSGGVGVAPLWSATPTLTTVTANLIGNVTGNCSGTAATVTGAAQTAITSVGTLSALTVTNPIVGSVTGSSATCSGLAATATALATARAINGVNFDGTAAITVTAAAGTLSGTELNAAVVTSSLTAVGTVTSGIWNAGAVTTSGAFTGATVYGSTLANSDLVLEGTSSATKTTSYIIMQPTGGNVSIGHSTPTAKLHIIGADGATVAFKIFGATGGMALFPYNGATYGAQFDSLNTAENAYLPLSFSGSQINFTPQTSNVNIGGVAVRATTVGKTAINIFNGTAPAGTLANGISIYSTSGECYIMDAAGNATLSSPHDTETGEWIFFSRNTVTGRVVRVEMEQLVAEVERLSGKSFSSVWHE